MRVAIPGVVTSYDAATQTATVQPVVRFRYTDTDGESKQYLPGPVPNVPILYPSGGGYSLTFPFDTGDPVLLMVADRSIAEWKATGAEDNTPQHFRRFDLSDAFAIPGGRSPADPLETDAVGDCMVLGEGAVSGLRVEIANGRIKIGTASTELLSTLSVVLGASQTWASAIATGWTATAVYAGLAGAAWGSIPATPAVTAAAAGAGVWATAATAAATASSTAATAFGVAKTAIDLLKKT